MKRLTPFSIVILGLLWMNSAHVFAQNVSKTLWTAHAKALRSAERTWYPNSYKSLSLDLDGMKGFLASAPMQKSAANHSSDFIIELPMPDGSFQRFGLVESPIMEPALAAQFPEIKTYAGQGIDDRTATIRCDITMFGFHGYILSASGTIYIDPVSLNDTRNYFVYEKKEIPRSLFNLNCSAHDEEQIMKRNDETNSMAVLDGQLRTYRLALAADYEYTQHYGGTLGGALSGITTTMNRVNGIYEKELDIHLSLVNTETSIIYTTPADPYTNSSGGTMLSENQSNLDAVIGNGNYDIGHVFGTGNTGIAFLSCVCDPVNKAKGVTGNSNPGGDPFDVDYVSHEMGHQFSAQHTYNTETLYCAGQRAYPSAYEPGSGSTIMGYAGICGSNDLQHNSDAYFHTKSFDDIVLYSQSLAGNSCPSATPGGNLMPVVVVPTGYRIPVKTAFRLSPISASDPDGGAITYCWEEWDLSGTTSYGQNWDQQSPGVNAPIFRSFNPTTSAERVFPKMSSLIDDTVIIGEVLPEYARTLHFRCTVRDNNAGCGGVTHSAGTTAVIVDPADGIGFAVTAPNSAGITWKKNEEHTVTWNVAGTSSAPINTDSVTIYMSFNNGQSWADTIGTVYNSGSYTFITPNLVTASARILIEAKGNIYFDINDKAFRIDTFNLNVDTLTEGLMIVSLIREKELKFKFLSEKSKGPIHVMICDISGKLIKEADFEKNDVLFDGTIELPYISSGIYLARFDLPDDTKKTVKFVKQ